jgi:geranylgeranyl diphosphate synthase type I
MSKSLKTSIYLPAIEQELQTAISKINVRIAEPFREMLSYHLGWTGEGAGPEAQGKRIRPLLLLMTVSACGADWQLALPAAAAVELIHNFSLVHDDIQDNSDIRHGRETVWKKWGMPMGINVGDALFVTANLAMEGLSENFPADTVIRATGILNQSCLELTEGQYLDLINENNPNISIEEYWQMVSRKTAALLSASTRLGAILGGADPDRQDDFRNFGHYLGLAFQVQDDYLGIWGDQAVMGKSSLSDLINGKNSLPILSGVRKQGEFAKRWLAGNIQENEITWLTEMLSEEGINLQTLDTIDQMMEMAGRHLKAANPAGEAGEGIFEIMHQLMGRKA